MEKGNHIRHRRTKRVGTIHSLSKKHPGWVKVLWEGETQAYRYEREDLELIKCEREHSECPGYFCVLPKDHSEVCLCN